MKFDDFKRNAKTMFERLKNVSMNAKTAEQNTASQDVVAAWAASQGFSWAATGEGKGFSLTGTVDNKAWRMDCGRSSRDYILGDELRARAELKLDDAMSVLIMSRPLKEMLEKRAYRIYTDTLQTTADPSLTEEMRWLALYPEVGWNGLPKAFWDRYAVLADQRSQAMGWVDLALAGLLLSWPEPAVDAQLPFILMLLRGKAYLRMQYTPGDLPMLQHATLIFHAACKLAAADRSTDIVFD
jgi:hypothetical protein